MVSIRKTALITGGSRGIGRAISSELAGTHHLLLGGRNHEELARVAADFPSAEPFAVDLTDEAAVSEACAGISALDVLVHSAGITHKGRIDEVSRDFWRHNFEVNVFAVADLTRLLLPALRRRRGQVILINSGSGFFTSTENAVYCGTKFALLAFANVLREEERAGGVRVCSIHPGKVDTDMQREIVGFDHGHYQPDTYLRPESVAASVRLAVDAGEDAMIESLSVRPRWN